MKLFNLFKCWRKIKEEKVPNWVKDNIEHAYSSGRVPYNKIFYLKGKTFRYKFTFNQDGSTNIKRKKR